MKLITRLYRKYKRQVESLGKQATIGALYDPIFKLKTQTEARAYFRALVFGYQLKHYSELGDYLHAVKVIAANIAYFAGYGTWSEMERILRLFRVSRAQAFIPT